ncbi:MAG: tripartite tricarboxylate transporter substrate-binding protein [Comamonadaceae bacterium]|nr:tripartite tricarboxylate transporter substrate-binding protein [Comamonadaceae bacterium]
MTIRRRQWLALHLHFATALLAGAHWPMAQAEDAGPVRLLVGYPPGGGTDALARLLARHLSQELGVTIVVDNRPGAAGQIAAQALKTSLPDGRTLLLSHDHAISILPQVLKRPGFDTHTDFQPVAGIATFVNCVAVASSHPARTWQQFVDWLHEQDKPSMLAVGVPVPASTPEFLVSRLAQKYEKKLMAVPYRGSAPMLTDLLNGQLQAGVAAIQDFMELHQAGKVRILGVLGSQRQSALPHVPTLAEMGIEGFESVPFYGLYAPSGIDMQWVQRWEKAVQKVLEEPSVHQKIHDWAMTACYMDHTELDSRERMHSQVWSRIIHDNGFAPR